MLFQPMYEFQQNFKLLKEISFLLQLDYKFRFSKEQLSGRCIKA